ncbi:MAG TPA: FAD-dependent oxidoreductase [Vicinamibacteria bacterium]|nr:FAD-dependent oxidoreductase [Vicinamibacteria bacterium]
MVTLMIDGQQVSVEAGTTVLEAARRLGIPIPTLCHVEGLEPVAACFLCCVQVAGTKTLSPSCALPAADGMVVCTESADIRASRRMALELLLSDHAGECIAPCAARCPAGLDVPGFVYEIASGQNDRAMERIYERLSLPGALGRVCPRLCEESCRRCDYDHEGLAIGALHRYATDRNQGAERPALPKPGDPSGKRVAIVGAGPAGLTVAFYLLQRGHACTIYDANPRPGGMLRYGIPEYRLPRAALDAEIEVVERLGASFRMNRRWGRDFTLADLRRDHDAVFLGIGAQHSSSLGCEGEDLALSGIELLHRIAEGERPALGRQVVVVGGGNTAMDCARTARRLGAQVRVLYRRTRREMPCLLEEAEGAEAEGVELEFLVSPLRLAPAGHGGHGRTLVCQRMKPGEPDARGRRRPVPIPASEFEVGCDTVIAAVGQEVDRAHAESEGLEINGRGLTADPRTLATNLPGVFTGGDAVLGPDLAVRAVAAGRVAAISIDQYLDGRPVTGPEEPAAIALRPIDDEERAAIFREIEQAGRVKTSTLGLERRLTSFEEIDPGLGDEPARREALRCLTCGCAKASGCGLRRYATQYLADPYRFLGERRRFERDASHPEVVYEPGKCVMCDACVRIAAEAGEELGLAIVGRGFDVSVAVPFGAPLSDGLRHAARRCAEACPTGAIALRTARACDLTGCGGCDSAS